MIEHMGERNEDEPDEGYQSIENPDTEPPATEETVEKDAQRDQAEGE